MISLNQVEEQLKRAGCNFRFWGRWEIRELSKVLMPDEVIAHIANGKYEGGFGLLAATDQRLLLIDRKPMFMALEDIRYDMIAEIDFTTQLLNSTVKIVTTSRTLTFSSWSQYHLREVLNFTQTKMMELRQMYSKQVQSVALKAALPDDQMGVVLGGLALQTGGMQRPMQLPMNPYTQTPVLMRRRKYPRFY
ncbi:MAG TPA: PH domain-containing protein [Candidatus Saccharimonadales bacterium]|nr:PH domain-containing protein [Candidatus Saccharimonadales bacterium]